MAKKIDGPENMKLAANDDLFIYAPAKAFGPNCKKITYLEITFITGKVFLSQMINCIVTHQFISVWKTDVANITMVSSPFLFRY